MGVIHSLKALSQISFSDFRTLPFLFACLLSLAGAGTAASETAPRIQLQFGGMGVQSDLACYFAGRTRQFQDALNSKLAGIRGS